MGVLKDRVVPRLVYLAREVGVSRRHAVVINDPLRRVAGLGRGDGVPERLGEGFRQADFRLGGKKLLPGGPLLLDRLQLNRFAHSPIYHGPSHSSLQSLPFKGEGILNTTDWHSPPLAGRTKVGEFTVSPMPRFPASDSSPGVRIAWWASGSRAPC